MSPSHGNLDECVVRCFLGQQHGNLPSTVAFKAHLVTSGARTCWPISMLSRVSDDNLLGPSVAQFINRFGPEKLRGIPPGSTRRCSSSQVTARTSWSHVDTEGQEELEGIRSKAPFVSSY